MKKHRDWSWLTQEKLQALVDELGTLTAVAKHLGTSRTNLSGLVRRRGMTIRYDRSRRRKKPSVLDQYAEILKHLASLGWTCTRICAALDLPVQAEQVRRWLHANGVELLARPGAQRGEWNRAWAGGGHPQRRRYTEVPAHEHPLAKSNGWMKEHRLVMEKKIGRPLKPGEVVHHIDGDVTNNHPDNLLLFPDNESHLRFHQEQRQASYQERLTDLRAADREYVRSLGW